MEQLEGRVAVVTGGGSGIGAGIARALSREGARLVVADIELDAAERVAEELRALGTEAIAVRTDVTETASLVDLAATAANAFGTVGILCNNAGVFLGGEATATTREDWTWMWEVNVMGVVEGVRAFLPLLRESPGGAHIVNTGSVSGLYPTAGQAAYCASKYAVVAFSERLRVELAPEEIGVSVLCPSAVSTQITNSRRNRHKRYGGAAFSPPPNTQSAEALDPGAVGKLVVDGIRSNRLYIHTHANWKRRFAERFDHILADFEAIEG